MTSKGENQRRNRGRRWLIVAMIAAPSFSALGGSAHQVASKEPVASETSTQPMRTAVGSGWTIESRGIRW